ncbi:MAG TPA: ribosomal protein S18-alanine N-acetyltransferase [Polyangiales bacterium]|nr:ribosomal protein S18-alanine N-acetyltransferase [Polyangiales bacterium]
MPEPPQVESPGPRVLPAREGDLRAVYDIAQACFPIPWPLEELGKELTRPYSGLRVLRPTLDLPVIGFLNYWHIHEEIQIMNVAVAPEQRRRGYGAALLADLCRYGRTAKAFAVVLEVRRSNRDAIALYERHGFERIGIRPRYYSDNAEDALVMRLGL